MYNIISDRWNLNKNSSEFRPRYEWNSAAPKRERWIVRPPSGQIDIISYPGIRPHVTAGAVVTKRFNQGIKLCGSLRDCRVSRHNARERYSFSQRPKRRIKGHREMGCGRTFELRRRKVDYILRVEPRSRESVEPDPSCEIYEHAGNSAGTLYSQAVWKVISIFQVGGNVIYQRRSCPF